MPTDPAKLRDELQARGLALLGAFVPVAFARESAHADGEERAVKTARLMAEAMGTLPFIVLADDNGKDTTRTKLAGRIQSEPLGIGAPARGYEHDVGIKRLRLAALHRLESHLRAFARLLLPGKDVEVTS